MITTGTVPVSSIIRKLIRFWRSRIAVRMGGWVDATMRMVSVSAPVSGARSTSTAAVSAASAAGVMCPAVRSW